MKTCYRCGKEIREDQKICYDCFKKIRNLREIKHDEIVVECDNREHGDFILRCFGMAISSEGYMFEIWKAKGQKSYHLHIKNIPHISDLEKKQLRLYKELFTQKYKRRIVEAFTYEPEGLKNIDFTTCISNHLIAEENKPHHKYKTEKKLLHVINKGNVNFCEIELYNLSKKEKEEYKPNVNGSGITAKIVEKISIVDIAEQFGLNIQGNKTLCPFHPDNKTPSLVFYENQGRFFCFGCSQGGNIIEFYLKLKELNSNFVYVKIK